MLVIVWLEVLHEWLKNNPSWKGVVDALRSPAVDEKSLADNIEREHCHHCSLPDLPEDVDDDIFYRKGAHSTRSHSTRSHYSASVQLTCGDTYQNMNTEDYQSQIVYQNLVMTY